VALTDPGALTGPGGPAHPGPGAQGWALRAVDGATAEVDPG
jgi:hypothetical protein